MSSKPPFPFPSDQAFRAILPADAERYCSQISEMFGGQEVTIWQSQLADQTLTRWPRFTNNQVTRITKVSQIPPSGTKGDFGRLMIATQTAGNGTKGTAYHLPFGPHLYVAIATSHKTLTILKTDTPGFLFVVAVNTAS